ncbi:MAG: glycosyltransferase [Eubacteriales bacterium]|nr:glycosyltransferase [Eubacteriales bacterium]
MGKIVFFCIPAHGHTNPTLGVVRELISRGHQVFYYSYQPMREKIQATGAKFLPCDAYDPQTHLTPEDGERVGKDLAFSTQLLVDMTLALDDAVLRDMQALKPDVIVADSMAVWGKLIARKLNIPFVSSTTTFAFNRYSSKVIGSSGGSLLSLLRAMPGINRNLKRLRARGYRVKSVLDIIANDNTTDTIVYTAREFQPCAETFSERYAFVGASIRPVASPMERAEVPTVYISMGTVLGSREGFYRACVEAFRDRPYRVILSTGETDLSGSVPPNVQVFSRVDQMAVLAVSDVFITHCGMNSVNEALYFGVPMVLLPQTPEQGGVANRTAQVGAGLRLDKTDPASIYAAVEQVLQEPSYRRAARAMSKAFRTHHAAAEGADKIASVMKS